MTVRTAVGPSAGALGAGSEEDTADGAVLVDDVAPPHPARPATAVTPATSSPTFLWGMV
ncbi:hypothetical protein GCM10010486_60750 [Nonomuraea roseoviolacea subsp. carminata]